MDGQKTSAVQNPVAALRDYVTPEDIQAVTHDVLRHRILLGFEAEASGRTPNEIIDTLLARIGVP